MEDNLGKALGGELPEANSPDGRIVLDETEDLVLRVEHQAGYVLLWHSGQLEDVHVLKQGGV